MFDGLLYRQAQVVEVNGLGSEVKSTIVHCLTDVPHVAIGRHHDTLQGWVAHFVNLRQQGQTVHLWHVNIRKDDVEVLMLKQHGQGFQSVVGKVEFVFSFTDLSSEVLGEQ